MKEEPMWRRYRRLFGPDPRADTDEELSFHLEMRVRDYMRRGMSESEARAAAASRLGDVEAVQRECGDAGAAEVRIRRRHEWLVELRQDIRYGARQLRRTPSFTIVAVATLALGIAATTAIFSLVDAVLLAPLPYPEPASVVRLWETSPQGQERNVVSAGNVVDWRERSRSFSALGAYRYPYGVALTGEGESARVVVNDMQPSVAAALNAAPLLGRTLVEEDAHGAGDVVVLSHALWRQRYGGDRAVLGRRIVLNDVAFAVIGVMPAGYAFPDPSVELWRPIRATELDATQRRSHNYLVIGRLASGATIESARLEMASLAAGIALEHPEHMTGWGVNVLSLHDDLTDAVRPLFTVLLGAAVVLLLIACGNLANLLLARAVGREREIAVRGALGAGRGRIGRQLLAESMLLAMLGGAAGLVLAPVLLKLLIAAAPADVPLLERAAIDWRMLLFAGATSLGCALLFGLAPAVRLLRTDLQTVLRAGRGASGRSRLRESLLVAQVALSVVLLIGAGLFIRSFAALQSTELGFAPANLVTLEVDLPRQRYDGVTQQTAFYEQLLERTQQLPGVVRAAGTSEPPGGGYEMTFSFSIEGRTARSASGREDPEQLRAVTTSYFEVLGQHVLRGRVFDERDRADGVPVVIINESLARKHWPGTDPIGARLAFRAGESPWLEVIGVVADVRLASPDLEPAPALYIPHEQREWPWLSWLTVIARVPAGTDPTPVHASMRTLLLELDAGLPPQALGTVEHAFRENLSRRSFALTLVSGFGAVALLLSVIGVYGLLAYSVAQQTKEIGVRLAMGARAPKIVRGVLGRSLALTLPGAAAGILIAIAVTSVIETLLYGVSRLDVATYAVTVLIVVAVALGAAAVPAWRAARVSPLHALRSD